MKKKLSNGEKHEAQLKFHYKELKRAGKLKKKDGSNMSIGEFRKSEMNAFVIKEVNITVRHSGKVKNFTRKLKKFVSLEVLKEAQEITFPAAPLTKKFPSKSERREARNAVRHQILKAIQEFAKARKEQKALDRQLRIDAELERRAKRKELEELREAA